MTDKKILDYDQTKEIATLVVEYYMKVIEAQKESGVDRFILDGTYLDQSPLGIGDFILKYEDLSSRWRKLFKLNDFIAKQTFRELFIENDYLICQDVLWHHVAKQLAEKGISKYKSSFLFCELDIPEYFDENTYVFLVVVTLKTEK